MASRANKNDVDVQVDEINNDVSQLADTLEDVLKSFGSDAKDEVDAARKKAEALLKETRARINGNQGRVKPGRARCRWLRRFLCPRQTLAERGYWCGGGYFPWGIAGVTPLIPGT